MAFVQFLEVDYASALVCQALCAQRAAKWNRCVVELREKNHLLSNTEALLEEMTKAKESLEVLYTGTALYVDYKCI